MPGSPGGVPPMMPFVRLVAGTGLLVLAMVLPFLPGRYDPLAVALSSAASGAAFGSLLLVPIAVTWLFVRRSGVPPKVALIAATLVAAVAALLAAASGSIVGGATLLVAAAIWLAHLWRRVATASAAGARSPRAIAAALAVVPLVAVAARLTLVPAAAVWSRDRAIASAAPLIADIEAYRDRTGAYPAALGSLWPDYPAGIIGIDRYRYEPFGTAYNLYFHPAPTDPATEEIVMYNPRGEADFSSHDSDLLRLSPDDIRRQRGYFRADDLPQAGWRRFLFD
jgi:hypothetical protein